MKRLKLLLAFLLILNAAAPLPSEAQGRGGNILPVQQMNEQSAYGILVPYKPEPLMTHQIPLILVHGIGAEEDKFYHWARFLEFADKNPGFQNRYKIYLFRYDSTQSVPQLSGTLQEALRDFMNQTGGRKFRILAYSEGGLLTRNALQDPLINAHTDKVITIATPFHGSPLANPHWLKKQLKTTSIFSPVRMTNKISYWVARKKYPSFEADFHWDNFDNAITAEEYARNKGRGELRGYAAAYSEKLITYGSYFGADIDPDQTLPKALGVNDPLPKEHPRLQNPFSKHFLFSLIRNNISWMPLAYHPRKAVPQVPELKEAPQPAPPTLVLNGSDAIAMPALALGQSEPNRFTRPRLPLMAYNDGISPISSTLWLGRYTLEFNDIDNPSGRLWEALQALKGSSGARLFPGLDHRDWMDGSTRVDTAKVKDLLHPEEAPRTVFEWFIYDLMRDSVQMAAS